MPLRPPRNLHKVLGNIDMEVGAPLVAIPRCEIFRLLVLLFVLWSLPALTASAANNPKVGDKPPPITLEKLLQAPANAEANWEKLKGKVVVLEFWATWCGPCVAAIPHLNELAEKYKDKPVQFIAVTNEDEKKIKPFLARRSMRAWVGLDTDQSMHKAYQVRAIPNTVVVDANGVIAAITHPTALNEKLLDDLVKKASRVNTSLFAARTPSNPWTRAF